MNATVEKQPDGGSTAPVAAAIDMGSNSIKMTVARRGRDGGLDELASASETVRLGFGLEATGRLGDDRMAAALATLHQFAEQARDLGASRIMAVATEAARAAANGPAFLDQIARETGIDVRVIDGEEEAALTFRGLAASADVTGDLLVADVGGGSTEIIVASDGQVRAARSLPLGSGRLTDRLVTTDPPTAAALADCRDVAAADLAPLATSMAWPTGTPTRLIVVGGTGEYLARLVPDGQRMTAATIGMVLERLQRLPAAELATTIGVVEARARVLPAGVAVVAAITDLMQPGWIGSARSGIRAGMLLAMLKPEPNSGAVNDERP